MAKHARSFTGLMGQIVGGNGGAWRDSRRRRAGGASGRAPLLEGLESRVLLSAPSSIGGDSCVLTVTSGTGVFASSGIALDVFGTNNTYQITAISGDVASSQGTYSYAPSGANTANIVMQDSGIGAVTCQLTFQTAAIGTFSAANGYGSQQGSFYLLGVGHGQAPVSIVGDTFDVAVAGGAGALASSGSFQLATGLTNYQILGGAGATASSGTYTYTQTGTSSASYTEQDSLSGTVISQDLEFDTATTGHYLVTAPATGSWQAGTFALTPTSVIGYVDVANSSVVSGWAWSEMAGASAVNMRVDIDGVAGTPFAASLTRNDLTPVVGSPAHGFSFVMPNLSPGTHTVNVYAIDPKNGSPVLLGTQTISGARTSPPMGYIDAASASSVTGWAFDPNGGANSIGVQVFVDGVLQAGGVANITRNDLTAVVGSPNHGFSLSWSGTGPGSHTIQVYAFDYAYGIAVLLGTAVVTNHAAHRQHRCHQRHPRRRLDSRSGFPDDLHQHAGGH